MKRFLCLLALITLTTFVTAQETAQNTALSLGLQDILQRVSQRTNVITAQLELSDSQVSLSRVQADPLAIKPDIIQAQHRSAMAQADYTQTLYETQSELVKAYTDALEAEAQRNLASQALGLSQQGLRIAQIRFDRGGATQLDVKDAENDLAGAQQNFEFAEEGMRLSNSNLSSLLGVPNYALQPISSDISLPLPTLDQVKAALENHPTLLQVKQGAEMAQIGLDLLDPSYSSRKQIDDAKLQLGRAQEGVGEARRGLGIQAQSLLNLAQNAFNSRSVELDGLRNAQERLSLEKQRLDSGLIPEITYNQTQLSTSQAQIAYMQAQHSYLNALLNLQAGTLLPIDLTAQQ